MWFCWQKGIDSISVTCGTLASQTNIPFLKLEGVINNLQLFRNFLCDYWEGKEKKGGRGGEKKKLLTHATGTIPLEVVVLQAHPEIGVDVQI